MLLDKTKRISFELSNQCNLKHLHKKCPLYLHQHNIEYLSLDIIFNIYQIIKKLNWKGIIAFHTYNEPTIDPRLFYLINLFKQINQYVYISTNGFNLNQQLLNDFDSFNTDEILVTTYNLSEFERLQKLCSKNKYNVTQRELDDRLNIYDSKNIELNLVCEAPLSEIIIGCSADIYLCCLDYKKEHSLGNLRSESFESIINSEKVINIYNNLINGKRELNLCKKYNWSR